MFHRDCVYAIATVEPSVASRSVNPEIICPQAVWQHFFVSRICFSKQHGFSKSKIRVVDVCTEPQYFARLQAFYSPSYLFCGHIEFLGKVSDISGSMCAQAFKDFQICILQFFRQFISHFDNMRLLVYIILIFDLLAWWSTWTATATSDRITVSPRFTQMSAEMQH